MVLPGGSRCAGMGEAVPAGKRYLPGEIFLRGQICPLGKVFLSGEKTVGGKFLVSQVHLTLFYPMPFGLDDGLDDIYRLI